MNNWHSCIRSQASPMAHQQLPLNNSLGVGGNNRHLMDPTTNNRYGEMSLQETTSGYPELNVVGQQQQLKQLPHSSSFNSFPPPPYPHTGRYITTDHCASSSSSALAVSVLHSPTLQQHVSAGSLPPITSFGVRQSLSSSSLIQLANIGGNNDSSQQSSQAVPMAASTSSHSSAACSPSSSPYQQQHNNHHSQFLSSVTNTSTSLSMTPIQRIESGQPQFTNSHGQQQQSSPTTQFGHVGHSQQNHHHQFQAQQMPSPAYSAHPVNSISNPASIVSAPPESPSSIRSSSVRSNYSLRMVNSTPDSTFMQNNNSNSEHQYCQDAALIQHQQDGQMPSRIGDGIMNNLPPAQQQKTPQTMKNAKKNYTPRTQRIKTPVHPLFQLDGPNPVALIIGASAGSEGPTVRQHLQQQQAAKKQKLQQEMMLKRLIKNEGELAMAMNSGGGGGTNGERDNNYKRSNVESAPPSVTAATTMMMDGTTNSFGGFQLNEWSSSGSQQLQRINIGPIHHQMLKAESLSPPKRNSAGGTNRSRNGGQGPKRTGGQMHTAAASSSEALASTIASVASGGGSLEEFEKFSGPGSSPSHSMLSNSSTLSAVHPGPSSSAAEQNFSPTISSAPKRRKTAATINTQQGTQKMSPMVLPTTTAVTPTRQIDSSDAPTIIEKKKDSTTPLLLNAQHQIEQISPSKQPHQQQKQCRIHVQNPPQHGDFPLTGTKIQVVHIQPSPTSASAGVPSPQTHFDKECSPRSFVFASRQQSPFTVGNSVPEMMASPDSTIPLPRNALISPYHAAPPQPPQRQQFLAPPTPSGTPMSDMATATHPIQCLPVQSPNDFQHLNTIINRQQQQLFCGGGQMAKYSTSLQQPQQQHLQQSSLSNQSSPLHHKQEMLVHSGSLSPSPHQYVASMAAPPPPPTPLTAPSPQQQMFRFHQQQQQSPFDGMQMLQSSQTPPQHHSVMAASYQHQMMQQQSPQNYPHPQQQQIFMSRGGGMPVDQQQQMGTTPPQHSSPMFSPHHPHAPPQQQYNIQGGRPLTAYMSTPPHRHLHSPHLQQILHQQQTSPIVPSHHSGGTFTSTGPSPGPPLEQMLHNSACQTPMQAGPSHQSIQHHPRAQLSRAQLLSRHSRELECETYAVKLYHLQRTIKALVYKNGALGDELARLNQRIHVVTEERKILAKRLQHHERNRIRRIQTHFRKAAAAAATAIKEEETETCEPIAGTSGSSLRAELKTEINSSNGSLCGGDGHNETGGMEEKADIVKKTCEDECGGGGGNETNVATLEVNCQQNVLLNETASSSNSSPNIPVAHLPPQIQLKIGTNMEMEQNCNNNKFVPNNLMISPQSDRSENSVSSGSGGINGDAHHEHSSPPLVGQQQYQGMALRLRTTSSNSTRTCRELSISPAEQLMGSQSAATIKASKVQQHEQRSSNRQSARRREQRMEISPTMDQQNVEKNLPNLERGGQAEMDETLDEDDPDESDHERQLSRAKRSSQIFNSTNKHEQQSMESATSKPSLLRPSPTTMTTRRQSMAIQQIPPTSLDNQTQMNCIGEPHHHLPASSISPGGGGEQHQNRRRTTTTTTNTTVTAATIGSQRRS